jgi:hypothetical protein
LCRSLRSGVRSLRRGLSRSKSSKIYLRSFCYGTLPESLWRRLRGIGKSGVRSLRQRLLLGLSLGLLLMSSPAPTTIKVDLKSLIL